MTSYRVAHPRTHFLPEYRPGDPMGPTEQLPMGHLRANLAPAGDSAVAAGRVREEVRERIPDQNQSTSFMALKHDAINSFRFSQCSDTFSTSQFHSPHSILCHASISSLSIAFYSSIFQSFPPYSTLFQSIPFKCID